MILYKSLVKPVLTYNFGTWGLAMKEAHERDVVHRKQLRIIIKDFKINNRRLYKNCQEEPISQSTKINKWKLLGHVLRLPTCTPIPTRKAMAYYFESPQIQRSAKEKQEQFMQYLLNNSRQ